MHRIAGDTTVPYPVIVYNCTKSHIKMKKNFLYTTTVFNSIIQQQTHNLCHKEMRRLAPSLGTPAVGSLWERIQQDRP